jgi:hypothetical protein
LEEQTLRVTGQLPESFTRLTVIKHGVTRFRITLHVLEGRLARGRTAALPRNTEFAWLAPGELSQRALSTTGRKIATFLTATSRRRLIMRLPKKLSYLKEQKSHAKALLLWL